MSREPRQGAGSAAARGTALSPADTEACWGTGQECTIPSALHLQDAQPSVWQGPLPWRCRCHTLRIPSASPRWVNPQSRAEGGAPSIGAGFAACDAVNQQESPVSAPDGAVGTFLAWVDFRNSAASGDVYAQRLDSEGVIATGWPARRPPVHDAGRPVLRRDQRGRERRRHRGLGRRPRDRRP